MGRKLTFTVGFAAGYVFGSRAGRQRYEAIRRAAESARDHPAVQSAAGVLRARAGQTATAVRERIRPGRGDGGVDEDYDRLAPVDPERVRALSEPDGDQP